MLLYQMSQWLNERQRLQSELRSHHGSDTTLYDVQNQIQELEERLYGQARQWMASYQAPAAIAMTGIPYEPPVLLDEETYLQ